MFLQGQAYTGSNDSDSGAKRADTAVYQDRWPRFECHALQTGGGAGVRYVAIRNSKVPHKQRPVDIQKVSGCRGGSIWGHAIFQTGVPPQLAAAGGLLHGICEVAGS